MLRRGRVALAVVVAWATAARAQVASDEFGIERFRLSMDRDGLLDVDWAGVPEHGAWSAGAFVGFAHDPLVIYDQAMTPVDALVDRRVTTGLVGSFALWDRLELGAGLDIVGYQRGADTSPTMRSLPAGGLGDLRFTPKVFLAGTAGVQLALVPALTIPAGSAGGYLREAGVTFAPALAVSGTRDRVRATANLGYRLKPQIEVAGLASDDEAFARVGVGVRLGSARAPLAELWWTTSIAAPLSDSSPNQVAIEMLGGGGRRVASAASVFVAGGLGLDSGFGVPDWRALVGVRVEKARPAAALRIEDADEDGVADDADKCASEREDKDGFADDDGCADPDNDGDGIADAQDRCAGEGEDKDGFQDDDGCPDPKAKLAGRIVDLEGRPIPNAKVTIELAGGAPVELTAGEDGRFATDIDGGAVKITARAPDYKEASAAATITVGGSGDIAVPLARAIRQGQLRGQVLSFAGKPLAATITVTGKTTASTTTDAEGNFTVELPEGTFAVTIESPGHVTQKRNVSVKLDGVTVLNVDLRGAK